MAENFYDLLGVDEDATNAEIKRAYRQRAREYHPDVNADHRANAQFKTVRRAYDVLRDETERSAYDRLGHEKYVSQRMKGLPSTEPSSSRSSSASDRSATTGGSGRQQVRWGASTATNGSTQRTQHQHAQRQQTRQSGTSAQRTGQQSHFSRTSTNGSRRRSRVGATRESASQASTATRSTHRERLRNRWVAVSVALAVYMAGLSQYALANQSALDALVGGLASDPAATLVTEAGLSAPMAFIRAAAAEPSLALLFPVGAAVLPLVLVLTVVRFGKGAAWLYAFGALSPLAGIAMGEFLPISAAWVDLSLFIVLPVVVTLVFLVDVGRYLWATH